MNCLGNILVVDDYEINRIKLTHFLEQKGHTVTLAENGREALDLISKTEFDLVLLDIVMPEMDGYQVLNYLGKKNKLLNLPVIVISASDEMRSVVRCIEMGAIDYLNKPFDPILLNARIGACLEKKRMQDREELHKIELAETNKQLETVNKNYMEMLGFVTHEIKSPLAAMQTMISIIVEGYLGDVSKPIDKQLIRIKRNCEDLQVMVKNYLDLSRAERGELVAHKSLINFSEDVLKPCEEQTKPLFDSRKVKLKVDCDESYPVFADQELLRIALINYMSNAAKYGSENGKAKLKVNADKNDLILSVWNEGPGFNIEDKNKLFGKFSRLKNENTSNKRGSGLGLFLIKRILEQHNGNVWAESEPGHWAKFSFSFPMNAV
ncbi:MAG: hybrid sensor histidine kinase/response regulator [bacterium]|nr:hybrid sensor histidine kinase/response regulator [bacterium]